MSKRMRKAPMVAAALVVATFALAAQVIPLWQVVLIFLSTAGLTGIVLALAVAEAVRR